jgi:hypothetical protein
MVNITVHVQDYKERPVSGARVFLDIQGFPTSTWLEDYTNGNGDVEFDISATCKIIFSVNGTEYQTRYIVNGDIIFITV